MRAWFETSTIAFLFLMTLFFAIWIWFGLNDEAEALVGLGLGFPLFALLASLILGVGLIVTRRSTKTGG